MRSDGHGGGGGGDGSGANVGAAAHYTEPEGAILLDPEAEALRRSEALVRESHTIEGLLVSWEQRLDGKLRSRL